MFDSNAMIRNRKKLDKFNRRLLEEERISHKKALAIYESLYKEGLALGVINSGNILDGLEVDIRIAKAVNGLNS